MSSSADAVSGRGRVQAVQDPPCRADSTLPVLPRPITTRCSALRALDAGRSLLFAFT